MAKFKLKTKKGVAKRFRRRKSGSIKHRSAFTGHLLSGKSKNRKRAHRVSLGLPEAENAKKINMQLPYGS